MSFSRYLIFPFIFFRISLCRVIDLTQEKENIQKTKLTGRSCSIGRSSSSKGQPFYRTTVLESAFYLFLFVLVIILFTLIFLGLVKAIIGFCCSKKFGELGLGLLIDLPRPLDHYQERSLIGYPVQYDIAGWPVHPTSKKRTVRILPKRTEFCLNVVFFMAYPLALILKMCAFCCCIRNYTEKDEKAKFVSMNVIRFDEKGRRKEIFKNNGVTYKECDRMEAEDTDYVIDQMKHSQTSMKKSSKSSLKKK